MSASNEGNVSIWSLFNSLKYIFEKKKRIIQIRIFDRVIILIIYNINKNFNIFTMILKLKYLKYIQDFLGLIVYFQQFFYIIKIMKKKINHLLY